MADITLRGLVQHDTQLAWLFHAETADEPVWLPKSQVEWDPEKDEMTIPEWLAKDKGLI